MSSVEFVRVGAQKTVGAFKEHLTRLGVGLPCDDAIAPTGTSPLAAPMTVLGRRVGNRFAVQPMEGWDGTSDGRPGEHTYRRWARFGQSGAKLIWGGEAVAVRHDGCANPRQLMLTKDTVDDIARLREALVSAHAASHGSTDDLIVGLQLTHSGRFSRPNRSDTPEPWIAYRHPLLDRRVGIVDDSRVISDAQLRELVEQFVLAAVLASRAGFDFVDLKHCHGYLGHELLSAHTRPGDYGGSLENRLRFLRETISGIRTAAPSLGIGVRISAFDTVPYVPDPTQGGSGKLGPGIPESYCECMPYHFGFGVDAEQPTDADLSEPLDCVRRIVGMGVSLLNITAGSPYYSHHIQRPALYPPSDGYQPPEDPLLGVARQMHVVRYLKEQVPGMVAVGTAYTYLQEYVPHVAQAAVRAGWVDFVGLGRMVLSYPELPTDVLHGNPIQTAKLCRTFSDCTTAPRSGLVSGCYPLDSYYKRSEAADDLAAAKRQMRERLRIGGT